MTEEIKQDRRSRIYRRSTTIPPFRYRGRDRSPAMKLRRLSPPPAISWIVYSEAHVLTEGGGGGEESGSFQEVASHESRRSANLNY